MSSEPYGEEYDLTCFRCHQRVKELETFWDMDGQPWHPECYFEAKTMGEVDNDDFDEQEAPDARDDD